MKSKRMRVRIEPMAVATYIAMLLSDRTNAVACILLAAAVHEAGHLLAARLLRIPLGELRLDLLGAQLSVDGRLLTYGEEWALCAAGPTFSLLLAALLAPLWKPGGFWLELSCASLLLGLLNLLPIRNFDGGRMLSALLAFLFGEQCAERVLWGCSVAAVLFLWSVAVYLLLRSGNGISLLFFSMSLFLRFFSFSRDSIGFQSPKKNDPPA